MPSQIERTGWRGNQMASKTVASTESSISQCHHRQPPPATAQIISSSRTAHSRQHQRTRNAQSLDPNGPFLTIMTLIRVIDQSRSSNLPLTSGRLTWTRTTLLLCYCWPLDAVHPGRTPRFSTEHSHHGSVATTLPTRTATARGFPGPTAGPQLVSWPALLRTATIDGE